MFDRQRPIRNIYEIIRDMLDDAFGHSGYKINPRWLEQQRNIKEKAKKSYLDDFNALDYYRIERIDKGIMLEQPDRERDNFVLYKNRYLPFRPRINGETLTHCAYSIKTDAGHKEILNNQLAFNQIKNIDEILIKMTRIMNASIDAPTVIVPEIGFALKLTDELKPNYNGAARLVAIDDIDPEQVFKDPEQLERFKISCENSFLDKFIGLNYGANVRRNRALRRELHRYEDKLIKKGRRQKSDTTSAFQSQKNKHIWEIRGVLEHYDFSK